MKKFKDYMASEEQEMLDAKMRLHVINNNLEGVKKAISMGADVDSKSLSHATNTPLEMALMTRNYDIAKYLIENGANIHSHREKPFEIAIKLPNEQKRTKENLDICDLLIKKGADIHIRNNEFFMSCMENNDFKGAKYLIDKGVNIYDSRDEALRRAILFKRTDAIKFLISEMDPQYVIENYPQYVEYLGPKYSHAKLAGKFGVFDDEI